jgi:hypothetical protein
MIRWMATGIIACLEGDRTIEHTQAIANQESSKATKLYDRSSGQITLEGKGRSESSVSD